MLIFLSHKMNGLTDDEVKAIRDEAKCLIESKIGSVVDKIDYIDNYNHDNVPDDAGRLWHLGKSIQQLEKADAIYFCGNDWYFAKGCIVEHEIANLYNIPILNRIPELYDEKFEPPIRFFKQATDYTVEDLVTKIKEGRNVPLVLKEGLKRGED